MPNYEYSNEFEKLLDALTSRLSTRVRNHFKSQSCHIGEAEFSLFPGKFQNCVEFVECQFPDFYSKPPLSNRSIRWPELYES